MTSAFSLDSRRLLLPLLVLPRLGVVHDKLLSGLVDQAKAYAKDMSPQALANTLWSFAKMEYHPGNEAMSSMVNVAGEKIVGFNGEKKRDGWMDGWIVGQKEMEVVM